ncbi:MAG: hypothetical protein JST54_05960 [Deltaproteobacteria bacterium]|nr:hypothetical protein [Deltaproteobacteria bacterium]
MKLSIAVGVVVALGLAGQARAGETVFTDEGWYRVEGSEPTPGMNAGQGTVDIEPAPHVAAVRPTAQELAAPPALPPMEQAEQPAAPPPCAEERGALARRLLTLHGLEVSRTELSDEELGLMPALPTGQANGLSGSVGIDPDLNALQGNVPIPPSSVNWDQESRQDFMNLVSCQARH